MKRLIRNDAQMTLKLPASMKSAFLARARAEGTTVGEITRQLLATYLGDDQIIVASEVVLPSKTNGSVEEAEESSELSFEAQILRTISSVADDQGRAFLEDVQGEALMPAPIFDLAYGEMLEAGILIEGSAFGRRTCRLAARRETDQDLAGATAAGIDL